MEEREQSLGRNNLIADSADTIEIRVPRTPYRLMHTTIHEIVHLAIGAERIKLLLLCLIDQIVFAQTICFVLFNVILCLIELKIGNRFPVIELRLIQQWNLIRPMTYRAGAGQHHR